MARIIRDSTCSETGFHKAVVHAGTRSERETGTGRVVESDVLEVSEDIKPNSNGLNFNRTVPGSGVNDKTVRLFYSRTVLLYTVESDYDLLIDPLDVRRVHVHVRGVESRCA